MTYPYSGIKDTGRGIDRIAYELIENLKVQGVLPEVVTMGYTRSRYEAVLKEVIFPLRMMKVKADVFHAIDDLGGKTCALMGKKPLITSIHDGVSLTYKGPVDWKYMLEFKYFASNIKICTKKSDMIITSSNTTRDILEPLVKSKENIRVIPYGVDHLSFFPERREPNKVKKILFVGKVMFPKGVDTLVRAFKILRDEMSDVELLIGSKGRHSQPLERLAASLGVSDSVRFLGYIPEEELRHYYNMADVFVFPSRMSFSLSLLEAMACGTPVIAGNVSDIPDYVGDSGLLIDPDDPHDLADALKRVLAEESFREYLSEKGIKRAREFSWEKMAKNTIEVYNEVIG